MFLKAPFLDDTVKNNVIFGKLGKFDEKISIGQSNFQMLVNFYQN